MKFVMAAELVSLTSEISVCENYEGAAYAGVPWISWIPKSQLLLLQADFCALQYPVYLWM